MIINTEEIKELLANEQVTGYRVAKHTTLTQQAYDRYKKGVAKLGNMPLETAIELQKYINMEESKMKLNLSEIKKLSKLDQVESNEKYYEFVSTRRGSYYNLFDSDLALTRRVRVDYTNKLENLDRVALKDDEKAMALPYERLELNENYVILKEMENTVQGLESMAKAVQSK